MGEYCGSPSLDRHVARCMLCIVYCSNEMYVEFSLFRMGSRGGFFFFRSVFRSGHWPGLHSSE